MKADLVELARRLSRAHGPPAAEWAADLPDLAREIATLWDLDRDGPRIPASYSYVAPVRLPGGPRAVLKLRFPGPEADREIGALRAYGGRGAVRLLRSDRDRAALLLESASPGTDAVGLSDPEGARALVAVMNSLHAVSSIPESFPTTQDWGRGFDRYLGSYPDGGGPIPEDLLELGVRLYRDLEGSADRPVLLHGDLHHENMLFDQDRGWLAVDPQGVVGEPAYEMGALLRNPINLLVNEPDIPARLSRRAELLCSLTGVDRERVLGWAVAQAVLSAIWAWEDQEPALARWVTIADGLRRARAGSQ